MIIVFGAGHVAGAKIWMGYNEDANMLDLAQRKADYAAAVYGQTTRVMNVRAIASYPGIESFCRGADLCSLEHSNADDSIDEPNEPNRVVVYRTVRNAGDGPCMAIGQACAAILNTTMYPVQHRTNGSSGDYYGAIGRAMMAGCSDAFLIEHGFHTHGPTRAKLLDPAVRQALAVAEVDAMAGYYGWTKKGSETVLQLGSKGMAVRGWQIRLIQWNSAALPKYKADSDFGGETVTWTNKFKGAAGLPADGIVDDLTWDAMIDALKPSGPSQAELDAAHSKISDLTDQIVAAKAAQMAAEQYATGRDSEVQRLAGKIDAFKRGLDAVTTA